MSHSELLCLPSTSSTSRQILEDTWRISPFGLLPKSLRSWAVTLKPVRLHRSLEDAGVQAEHFFLPSVAFSMSSSDG